MHDEGTKTIGRLLIDLHTPIALGVIYREPSISYEDAFYAHHPSRVKRTKSSGDFIKGPSS